MRMLVLIAGLSFWLVAVGAVYWVYQSYGLPNLLWSYSFIDNDDRYNPHIKRFYTSCTYLGPYGAFTQDARNGRCPLLRLHRTN